MNVGLVGLGRMGKAIAYRISKAGHKVIAYDVADKSVTDRSVRDIRIPGLKITSDITDLTKADVIWIMVPEGSAVDDVIKQLSLNPDSWNPDSLNQDSYMKKGSILIDGGNSHFSDTIKRYKKLLKKGIYYLDCGTSGGLHGKDIGFSLMIGGDRRAFNKVKPIFKAIAAKDGFEYMGPSGSGHYVKMVHNGIEYALLQSYAEGLNLLKNGKYNLNLKAITKVWSNGSVIRSWIVNLLEDIFKKDQDLKKISGAIGENKTGYWTVQEAKRLKIPVDLISKSLRIRKESRKTGGNYATKIVAMLRNKFGGHSLG